VKQASRFFKDCDCCANDASRPRNGLALVVQSRAGDDAGTFEAALDAGRELARIVLGPAGLRIDLVMLDRTKLLEVAVSAQPIRFGGSRALVDADDGLGMECHVRAQRVRFLRSGNSRNDIDVYYVVIAVFFVPLWIIYQTLCASTDTKRQRSRCQITLFMLST
jgi:hypothetical protein